MGTGCTVHRNAQNQQGITIFLPAVSEFGVKHMLLNVYSVGKQVYKLF